MSHLLKRVQMAGERRRRALVLLMVLAAAASGPAGADEPRPGGAQAPPPPAAPAAGIEDEIVRYMAVSRPGAEHRWLDPLVGSWTVDLRWQGAGRVETHVTGTSENRWILDGRFLMCESTAGDGPSRIDGTTIYGFDNRLKKYFALRLSNLATYTMQPSGSYDPATHSFLLSGKERDEVTGGVLVYRELLSVEGPDRHVLRVYFDVPGRSPVRVLEAVYTRR
jgi:hypothetical protein